MEHIFFNGASGLIRTLIVGVLAYVTLICFLRISGKRTLSKMNAFDLIVTVSLGSTLATVMLSKDVALAEAALAFALLISLQFTVTWTSVRVRWVRRMVTGEPLMLFHQGQFLASALRQARVTEDEIRAAAREAGIVSLGAIEAVILETDGKMSVIKFNENDCKSSLSDVQGQPR